VCNMRSSLLHLQFLYCSLSERISEQRSRIARAHRDRLMQYSSLWEEYICAEQANFKRVLIIKLEGCLSLYANDHTAWQLIDSFANYAGAVEHELVDSISKLYLGKRVMLDIGEVEQQLGSIEERIIAFMNANGPSLDEYGRHVQAIGETREVFSGYLAQIRALYEEVEKGYYHYLRRKLQ
jgi:hypothetical protein